MMRPEMASPGFDFRDDRELFKEIGNMVPGATLAWRSRAVAPLALKAPNAVSKSPKSFVRVWLGMKTPHGRFGCQLRHPAAGIATKAWPEAAYAYLSPRAVQSPLCELPG
jgi:hypothetical protein